MAYLDELVERYPKLSGMRPQIMEAYQILVDAYAHGGKLLIAGNGGSCADAEHIVGELMKGFVKRREVPQEFAEKLEAVDESKGRKLAMQLQGG
ncbi:MAG: SIS domain-containing protein, partial [Hungatella sp.]